MNNKAQVTMFIIIAILLVASLFVLVFFRRDIFNLPGAEENPKNFMEMCIKEEMRNSVNKVLSQGGFLNPENFHSYSDEKVSYLCKNIGLYGPCINQHPMFLNEIKLELENNINPVIDSCFQELQENFEDLGYEVSLENEKEFEIVLAPENIFLNINKSVSITKAEEVLSFEDLKLQYKTSLYELASIANNIAKNEAEFCYFEYLGYMNLYPRYLIELKVFSDSTKVYSILDTKTQEKLNIAIRGCALG